VKERSPDELRSGKDWIWAKRRLFLPGPFLMTVGAQLFATFVFIDLRFTTFL
jgi:hypothetical protein